MQSSLLSAFLTVRSLCTGARVALPLSMLAVYLDGRKTEMLTDIRPD
jgi:hypothetical protein